MKKTEVIVALILINISLNAQTIELLKAIADKLVNYRDYQAHCVHTFSYPHGGSGTVEVEMVTQKKEEDTLCGFFYCFSTNEKYRKVFGNFMMYFNKAVYSSKNGEITKIAFWEEPERFEKKFYPGGFTSPPIHESHLVFSNTPYKIGDLILKKLDDNSANIYQKADTLINGDTCMQFILDVPTVFDGGKQHTFIFNKQKFYPISYSEEIYRIVGTKNQITGRYTTKYSDTKINCLSSYYFTEDNLLGKNWWSKIKREENTQSDDLIGKKVPNWILPVYGKEDSLSSDSLKGKYVLLEFTATWCGHCITAAKFMNRLEEFFKDEEKIEIVSIFSSSIDNESSIENFTKMHNLKSTILYQAKNIEEQFNIIAYPSFFIITPDGIVLKSYLGYSERFVEEITTTLKKH